MKNAVGKRGQGENKADERSGRPDVEKRTNRTNGRTNQDKGAEGADESVSRKKEGVAGINVVMTTGEVMPEFMGEENDEQRESEGDAVQEISGMKVGEAEGLEEGVEGGGLVVGIGSGEMRAGDERGQEREKKQDGGEDERAQGRKQRDGAIVGSRGAHLRPGRRLQVSGRALVGFGRSHEILILLWGSVCRSGSVFQTL